MEDDWVVYITGMDEFTQWPDEITALREANKVNRGLVDYPLRDQRMKVVAVVKNRAVEAV